jgi:hypothetical protein
VIGCFPFIFIIVISLIDFWLGKKLTWPILLGFYVLGGLIGIKGIRPQKRLLEASYLQKKLDRESGRRTPRWPRPAYWEALQKFYQQPAKVKDDSHLVMRLMWISLVIGMVPVLIFIGLAMLTLTGYFPLENLGRVLDYGPGAPSVTFFAFFGCQATMFIMSSYFLWRSLPE